MILYREGKYTKMGEHVVHFDDESVRSDSHAYLNGDSVDVDAELEARILRGSSRKTKNIGLLVGLESKVDPKLSCIVVTCHLFWNPA